MINFEETEHDREEFRHEFIINITGITILYTFLIYNDDNDDDDDDVTGKQERYYSPKKRSLLVALSFGIVFAFCGIVIGTCNMFVHTTV